MDYNKKIYREIYSKENLELDKGNKYDLFIYAFRLNLIQKYVNNNDLILDLCCGTGKYYNNLINYSDKVYGLDFSEKMLLECKNKRNLICADATNIPLSDNSLGLIFSYSSLYHIQDIDTVFNEIHRILKPNGIAVIELTNFLSLGHFISYICHKLAGWAKPCSKTDKNYNKIFSQNKFKIVEVINYQLLPLFGTKFIQIILPFSSSFFKRLMALKFSGVILDLYLSNLKIVGKLSFKRIYILKK